MNQSAPNARDLLEQKVKDYRQEVQNPERYISRAVEDNLAENWNPAFNNQEAADFLLVSLPALKKQQLEEALKNPNLSQELVKNYDLVSLLEEYGRDRELD